MARKELRQSVNRPATIVVGKDRLLCRIVNVSRMGATLVVPSAVRLPKSFEVEDVFSGIRRRATVAWADDKRADGKKIGVRFERAVELAPEPRASAFGRRKA
jgi:PilZ domain